MNLPQRKRHLYIWVIIGLFLPLIFAGSLMVIPQDKIDLPEDAPAKHILLHHSHEGSALELEIIVQKPLASSASLVLLSEGGEPESSILVGQIQGMGSYNFQISEIEAVPSFILIYNPFTETVTYQIPL